MIRIDLSDLFMVFIYGFISNNKNIINKAMKNIAPILEEGNMTMHGEKTIQHTINRKQKMTGRSVNTLEYY